MYQPNNLDAVADFYNSRFQSFGRDIKSVGWGTVESQHLRFECLLRDFDLHGKTILDVGCGLGDLVSYLDQRTCGDFTYYGIDIASSLVTAARNHFQSHNCTFLCGDLFTLDLPLVDISVASGSLSFAQPNIEPYAQQVLQRMFQLSSVGISANFLTSFADYQLPKNHHYDPSTVFTWAKRISRYVTLIHDYDLYEFTIKILRNPVLLSNDCNS